MQKRGLQMQLTDNEFRKLAEQTGISQYDLQKLYSMNMLKERSILDLLIRHDYHVINRLGKYKPAQIFSRLAMYYHVSVTKISSAVYVGKMTKYYCEECGKLIRKSEYKKNDGLCNECVTRAIELP